MWGGGEVVEKIRTVLYLPLEVKKQIKMEAVRQNTNMSELVEKILREYFSEKEGEKKND